MHNSMSQLKTNKRFSIMFQHTKRGFLQSVIREEVNVIILVDKDF